MSRLFRAKDILQTLRQPPEDLQFHEIVVPSSELDKEQEQVKLVPYELCHFLVIAWLFPQVSYLTHT